MLIVDPLDCISFRHLLFMLMTASGIAAFNASKVGPQRSDRYTLYSSVTSKVSGMLKYTVAEYIIRPISSYDNRQKSYN